MKFITKTPEELVQMALDITDGDKYARVLVFADNQYDYSIETFRHRPGVYTKILRRYTSQSGGTVSFGRHCKSDEDVLMYSGIQLTHLFLIDNITGFDYLVAKSRMRSTHKLVVPLGIYNEYGIETWNIKYYE